MTFAKQLLQKISDRTAVVGIIGLGYVGLPLAREFCAAGFRVFGFDIDATKVAMLGAGKTYIRHMPGKLFKKLITDGSFTPTTDMALLRKPDAILICVPTPLDKMREPDMSFVRGTVELIAKRLRKGQLIVNGTPYALADDPSIENIGDHRAELNLSSGSGSRYGPSEIPAGHVLVMGDYRGNSHDGRMFGSVPASDIYGRAIAVFLRRGDGFTWRPL